jgi:hypothetical protein
VTKKGKQLLREWRNQIAKLFHRGLRETQRATEGKTNSCHQVAGVLSIFFDAVLCGPRLFFSEPSVEKLDVGCFMREVVTEIINVERSFFYVPTPAYPS